MNIYETLKQVGFNAGSLVEGKFVVYTSSPTFYVTAPSGTTLSVDWGDGTALEDFAMTGESVTVSRSYSESKLRGISFSGTGNTGMTKLKLYPSRLTHIDISENINLIELDVSGATMGTPNKLKTLDISANTALETLNCIKNDLTTLDVSNNTALKNLYCGGNELTALDVSNNTALEILSVGTGMYSIIYGNNISAIDISNNINLTRFECGYNSISSVDISNNINLTHLDVSYNSISAIDVTSHIYLTTLGVNNNNLSALNVSNNTALTTLYCQDNNLSTLDVSSNTALVSLYCEYNSFTTINVSNNSALKYLSCRGVTTLDISHNNLLDYVSCVGLASLTVSSSYTSLSNGIYVTYGTLTSTNINSILSALVATGLSSSNRKFNCNNQTPSAPPTGQGLTDKQTLIDRGWTITTD